MILWILCFLLGSAVFEATLYSLKYGDSICCWRFDVKVSISYSFFLTSKGSNTHYVGSSGIGQRWHRLWKKATLACGGAGGLRFRHGQVWPERLQESTRKGYFGWALMIVRAIQPTQPLTCPQERLKERYIEGENDDLVHFEPRSYHQLSSYILGY